MMVSWAQDPAARWAVGKGFQKKGLIEVCFEGEAVLGPIALDHSIARAMMFHAKGWLQMEVSHKRRDLGKRSD